MKEEWEEEEEEGEKVELMIFTIQSNSRLYRLLARLSRAVMDWSEGENTDINGECGSRHIEREFMMPRGSAEEVVHNIMVSVIKGLT